MLNYQNMTRPELEAAKKALEEKLADFKAKGLKLNMARGKPSSEQLDLSMEMLDVVNSKSDCHAEDGADCRNYCDIYGIPEAIRLFSEYMGVQEDEIVICGQSSLQLLYDALCRAMLQGVLGSEKPWGKCEHPKFICPVPGYDKHFGFCKFVGLEMIPVPLHQDGPDMDVVEKLVAEDESIKGMWCMPKFSNPFGACYSDEVVRRLASMKCAAKDFRLFWDNAYSYHIIYKDHPILNMLDVCKEAGNPDRVFMFGSTSKITMAGSGVTFIAASKANTDFIKKQYAVQTVGWDKMNMLRHVRYLKNMENLKELMKKHAAILRPRFDAVLSTFDRELTGLGVGDWTRPDGGFFVTYMALPGCAKRIVQLCADTGVTLTNAGATHPNGFDPDDMYIRIAPTYPPLDELKLAMEIFCVAVKLASVEKLLAA